MSKRPPDVRLFVEAIANERTDAVLAQAAC